MILVTGGGGFLGKAVCKLLHREGLEVLAVDRSFARTPAFPFVEGDLNDPGFLSGLLSRHSFNTVIHLASLLRTASLKNPAEALRTNIGVSLHLIGLAVEAKVGRFVFGSSISTYGTKRYAEHGEVSETEPASPGDVYGTGKRYVEIAGKAMTEGTDTRFCSLRIPIVIGKGIEGSSSPWRSEIFEAIASAGQRTVEIPFAENEMIPLSHVEDAAAAICAPVELPEIPEGVYNTPAENWITGKLGNLLSSLNVDINVIYGKNRADGIPQAIDDKLFRRKVGCKPVAIPAVLASMG